MDGVTKIQRCNVADKLLSCCILTVVHRLQIPNVGFIVITLP